jgi:putative transposase
MKKPPSPHYRHRFPAELISHAVWLYHVFSLSFRDVELLLAERGIIVSYESIRRWCGKFGSSFAANLCRRRPRPGDKWHLDESSSVSRASFSISGGPSIRMPSCWIFWCRGAATATRFFKRLLKGFRYTPRVLVTDKLKSYGVAKRKLLPDVDHRQSRYLDSRAENSHRPTRRRERQMQRFKSLRQALRFLEAHTFASEHFRPRRHRMTASDYRAVRTNAFKVWIQETCAQSLGS